MEDAKKRRTKRKKNKGNKGSNVPNEVSIECRDSVSRDQIPASSEAENGGNGGEDSEVALSVNGSDGNEAILPEHGKQQSEREAALEEMVRHLRTEKDSYIQKEATLEDTINELRNGNDLYMRKEAQLHEDIKLLQDKKNSYIQNEASAEAKLIQLRREKESWLQREGQLEETISRLVEEKNIFCMKEAVLEERLNILEEEKRRWILKEELNNVTTANLNDVIAGLRAQVMKLEQSRNEALYEKQQLMENAAELQRQIKDVQSIASTRSSDEITKLASERDELKSQVEKLIQENSGLFEKVSELLVELDRQGGASGRGSTTSPEPPLNGTTETATFSYQEPEINADLSKLGHAIDVFPVKEESNGINNVNDHPSHEITEASDSDYAGEIVQIPLEESDSRDLEIQAAENDGAEHVSFTDSPLIGAPFRFVYFVSRYVTGADLVDKNSQKL